MSLMIRQRLINLVDDLAGIRILHNFRVSVVPAVLSLLPVQQLLAIVRPTRLRQGIQPRLSAWLASFPAPSFRPITCSTLGRRRLDLTHGPRARGRTLGSRIVDYVIGLRRVLFRHS